MIPIDPGAAEPVHQQVYRGLRDLILSGRVAPGARLPSTRALAAELGVARNTVVPAFEQLRAEGLVAAHAGGGTRVVTELPDSLLRVRPRAHAPGAVARRPVDLYGPATPAARPPAFLLGVPSVDEFPHALWGRLLARRWRRSGARLLTTMDPLGYAPLRRAIAAYVGAARGVRCAPEQVIVTAGAQPALALAARAVLQPGDAAWVEEPGFRGVKLALEAAGARLVPVPVRDCAIDVAEGIRRAPRARLACVTPSNQHPLGGAMPLATRAALLEWAERQAAWILEDDYDSEFRYTGRPLPALQGLARSERVIYVGTFSKTLFPGLRLGFLVPPPALVPTVAGLRAATHSFPPALEQAALADFIDEGHFARHVRRMRALYDERQATLRALAASELGERLTIEPIDCGMRLVGRLTRGVSDRVVRDEAARRGVEVLPISEHYLEPGDDDARNGLLLGFAAFDRRATRLGLRQLAAAIDAATARAAPRSARSA